MRRMMILLALVLTLWSVPAQASTSATAEGHTSKAFQREVKAKHIKLKKYACGGTVLFADSKLSEKRIQFIRKCIKSLPKQIRKKAKRVYFVRKKYYLLTGTGLKPTSGYTLFPAREVWLYNCGDTDELMDTVFHEFAHCWDWNVKKQKFTLSTTNQWEQIYVSWLGATDDPCEWFAYCFAELWTMLQDPDFNYIYKHLVGG